MRKRPQGGRRNRRVGRTVVVAPTDAQASDAAYDPKGQDYFTAVYYLTRQTKKFNFSFIMKPTPRCWTTSCRRPKTRSPPP